MTRFKCLFLLIVALALLLAPNLQAQTVTQRTTLSTAITATNSGTITVTPASMTSIVATSAGGNPNGISSTQNFCLIDGELGQVASVATSNFQWRRGSSPSQHLASAEIRCGPGGFVWTPSATGGGTTAGVFFSKPEQAPAGACTRANNQSLPVFQVSGGKVTAYDCPNNVTSTTGQWVSWDYSPGSSSQMSRTILGSTVTAYTALPSDSYIAVTSVISDNTTITITLPCSSVPVNNTKVWIVGDEGGKPGTTGAGISIVGAPGAFKDTQQILAGFTAKGYRSNGTNCFRLF